MSVTPSPSASRGEVILQSTYFTSSLYVNALRNDITKLVALVRDEYAKSPSTPPFAHFKIVWRSQGWHYLHFMVFDNQSRSTFLDVTTRLFLGPYASTSPLKVNSHPYLYPRKSQRTRAALHRGCCHLWPVHLFLHATG